jgi:hypothetical protein
LGEGVFFSTVGLDEKMVREYIRNQEKQDEHREQLKFGIQAPWVQIIALRGRHLNKPAALPEVI